MWAAHLSLSLSPAVRESLQNGCSGVTQLWTLIGASVSHVLLTLNSSINFVIYCFMCTNFRRLLYRNINKYVAQESNRRGSQGRYVSIASYLSSLEERKKKFLL